MCVDVCVCGGGGGGGGGWWWCSGLGLGLMIHESWVRVPPLADEHSSLPPTTPTSPPSCEWVPGISWGANHFSLNSSGPGGTSGAHTTCCEKVAGPPASS